MSQQSLQELQETAYFDVLRCLCYTKKYSFREQGMCTKLRKLFDIPMEQHKLWHKALESAEKTSTFDYERPLPVPVASVSEIGAPADEMMEDDIALRQPSIMASSANAPQPPGPAAASGRGGGAPQMSGQTAVSEDASELPTSAKKPRRGLPEDDPFAYLGLQVNRLWADKWVIGVVTDWKPDLKQHCLTYDLGTKKETYEDVALVESDVTHITDIKVDLTQFPTSRAIKTSKAMHGLGPRPSGKNSKRKLSDEGTDDDEDEDD